MELPIDLNGQQETLSLSFGQRVCVRSALKYSRKPKPLAVTLITTRTIACSAARSRGAASVLGLPEGLGCGCLWDQTVTDSRARCGSCGRPEYAHPLTSLLDFGHPLRFILNFSSELLLVLESELQVLWTLARVE